jgi:hypothetical protein
MPAPSAPEARSGARCGAGSPSLLEENDGAHLSDGTVRFTVHALVVFTVRGVNVRVDVRSATAAYVVPAPIAIANWLAATCATAPTSH